jgi:restriction endonuclease S subunit
LFSVSNHCFVLKSKTEDVLIKYIYYYFLNNIDILKMYYKGATIKNISKDDLKKIKIPIPIIEKQIEIIQYCENNDNNIKQLENEIILKKKMAVNFLTDIITRKNHKENEEIKIIKAPPKSKKNKIIKNDEK